VTQLPPFRNYLLAFDRDTRELVEFLDFGHAREEAVAAYAPKEREYAGNPRIEVVLLASDSVETLRITHPNYFGALEASRYFDPATLRPTPAR
jgi:hypothetical protein